MDEANIFKTRPATAKLRIEIGLTRPLVNEILVEIRNEEGNIEKVQQNKQGTRQEKNGNNKKPSISVEAKTQDVNISEVTPVQTEQADGWQIVGKTKENHRGTYTTRPSIDNSNMNLNGAKNTGERSQFLRIKYGQNTDVVTHATTTEESEMENIETNDDVTTEQQGGMLQINAPKDVTELKMHFKPTRKKKGKKQQKQKSTKSHGNMRRDRQQKVIS
ncbi:hypothetical protein RND71_023108 [Anisodus tanguticus]|uniref:Uncharacterized protein n=1 Tax=Anisodus tanguticus TaxID=243964 RepID=A0AAE1RUZ9_9SOLA|nr:hypothetical protein RND71_023108 [Anisodus tanguticus]